MKLRAIYHWSVRPVRRSLPQAAAYITGSRLYDAKAGVTRDFSKRQSGERDEIVFSELRLPGGRDETVESFVNRVAAKNGKPRAVFGRHIDAAIPAALTEQQMIDYVGAYGARLVEQYSVGVITAIHRPRRTNPAGAKRGIAAVQSTPSRNWHVHFILSYCTVNAQGKLGAKQNLLDPTNCSRMRVQNFCEVEREEWADATNCALQRAGIAGQVDHRTLLEQGLLDQATRHFGARQWATEHDPRPGRKRPTPVGDYNRSIVARNAERTARFPKRREELARYIAQKQLELERVERALRLSDEATKERIATKTHARKALHLARRRLGEKWVQSVHSREGLVFMRDGGLLLASGRFITILADGDAGRARGFVDLEGLNQDTGSFSRATMRVRRFAPFNLLAPGAEMAFDRHLPQRQAPSQSLGHPSDDDSNTWQHIERL